MRKWEKWDRQIKKETTGCNIVLQFKGLVPGGIEAALHSFGLLFALTSGIWDQFKLHVGV